MAATAQTGLAALENPAQQLYRLNLTAFQPYVGDRRLSLAGGPFVEYRSDVRDRSWGVGFEGSLRTTWPASKGSTRSSCRWPSR